MKKREAMLINWLKLHRSRVLFWARLIITVGLLAFVISLVAHDEDKLKDVDWTLVPLAWLLMLISTTIKAFRWSLLVRQSHMNIPFRSLLASYLVGSFFSTVLPTSVGGDAVRAVDVAAHTGRKTDSASSVLIERGVGLLAIAGFGSVFALFLKRGTIPLSFILFVHAMTIGGIVGIIMLRQGWLIEPIVGLLRRFKLAKIADKLEKVQIALAGHLGSWRILGSMVILSLMANALTISATYIVMSAVMTNPAPLKEFVPMLVLITTAELIPISIASLGVKESAYVFFLGLIGVGQVDAGVIAIIMRVLTWGHALLGGIVFLVRTLRSSSKAKAAQAGD
jgi:uncharacterized protein (TIRG00374 family)